MGVIFIFYLFACANQQASKPASKDIYTVYNCDTRTQSSRKKTSFIDYKNSDIRTLHIMLGLDLSNSSEEDSGREPD
jgi:hypothetical protein